MKRKCKWVFVTILLILITLVIQFARFYPKACDNYAVMGIKGEVSFDIYNILCAKLDLKALSHSKIVDTVVSSDGSISQININTNALNITAVELSNTITKSIRDNEYDFGIPLGNALGLKFMSGYGPSINVLIQPLNATTYEITSEIKSSGINQTLHRITIKFKTEVLCLSPFHEASCVIENEIVVAETLIIGRVPEINFQR